ncbi:rhomboid family intramembrane serine protease [Candidatus Pacearchaeota archaeon]|nr:rhomboid family intramembrane serine protease [Candidatus Pacearchaeota archaeon]
MKNYKVSLEKKEGWFSGISITNRLIFINIFLYIISILAVIFLGGDFFVDNLALTPSLILSGEKLWTFLTSFFLHASFFHIFANMFSLFFVGNFLERIIGQRRFLAIYFVSALLGGLFFVGLAYLGQYIPYGEMIFGKLTASGVGASGAIFGIIGVLTALVPYSRIYLILGPLLLIMAQTILDTIVPISFAAFFGFVINILIILMIFSLFSFNPKIRKFAVPVELRMWVLPIIAIVPLIVISFFFELPIANSAHIGGLIAGVIYGLYLREKFPRKTKIISDYFR